MTVSDRIPGTPARRLRDAVEPLAAQGFYAAAAEYEALGLTFIPGYVWGRAAALGEPSAGVVVAAFGVFEPTFLAQAYEAGRATAGRADVLAARAAGAGRQLQEVLGDDARVGALGDVLLTALDALPGTGRPLFNGVREMPVPDSAHGRLWRACDLAREHRGDGHLAACVAAGLDPVSMNVLTELWVGYPLGAYAPTRGFGPPAVEEAVATLRRRGWMEGDELAPAGAEARADIEAATDRSQDALVSAAGDRLPWVIETASALSTIVVESGAFKGDDRKRAAG